MAILEMPPVKAGTDEGGHPYSKREWLFGKEVAWAGALHANRVSSRWKVQRLHVRSRWPGLLQESRNGLGYLTSPRLLGHWGRGA